MSVALEVVQNDFKLELARQEILKIGGRNQGYVPLEDVVEDAKSPASPLHDFFDWNDTECAQRYRIIQAGQLMRRLKITLVRVGGEVKKVELKTVRAFQSRESQRKLQSGGYEAITDIMSDEDKKKDMIAQVLRELEAYRKRYADLEELSELWTLIDNTQNMYLKNS